MSNVIRFKQPRKATAKPEPAQQQSFVPIMQELTAMFRAQKQGAKADPKPRDPVLAIGAVVLPFCVKSKLSSGSQPTLLDILEDTLAIVHHRKATRETLV